MKRIPALLLAIAIAAPLFAEDAARYIVATRRPARLAELRMLRDAEEVDRHVVRTFREFDGFAATLTAKEAADLRRSQEVLYVSQVVPRYIADVPTTQETSGSIYETQQVVAWGVDAIHARDVWPVTKGDSTTTHVAIVDTGIDRTHPDLAGKYAGGYDVFSETENQIDDNKHGTHVAGIVTANDNAFGTLGAAPNVKVWAVKVLHANGGGTDESLIAGMEWVMKKKKEIGGNWIVNLSLAAIHPSDAEQETFRKAIADNILIVAAAGNHGFPGVEYPAGYDDVIAVGALEPNLELAGFSNFGFGLTICAPGLDIPSTVPVGFVNIGDVAVADGAIFTGSFVTGSPRGDVTGPFVFCGQGRLEDFPASVKGKIAVVRRDPAESFVRLFFRDKVRNAVAAGAIAVVLMNDDDTRQDWPWTLIPQQCLISGCYPLDPEDAKFPWPLTVSIGAADGQKLLANANKTITASYRSDSYLKLSGTSMATPYVVASAALAWGLAPKATAEDVRNALKKTAKDLNTPGVDELTAYGMVDALKAAQFLNRAAFGIDKPIGDPKTRD